MSYVGFSGQLQVPALLIKAPSTFADTPSRNLDSPRLAGRSLRVLMISPQFRPIVGGYERAAERLAVALVGRGHHVSVLTERRDLSWPSNETLSGVHVTRWPCVFRPGFHLATSLASLAYYLLRFGRQFDVWHVHQYGYHAALAVAMGKVLSRRTVVKLTSSGAQGISAAISNRGASRLIAAALRRADAVVALTRETAAEALSFGIPTHRVHCLGNGVETTSFSPVSDQEKAAAKLAAKISTSFIALYIGRLSPEKGALWLVTLWERALRGFTGKWTLVVLGDGDERSAIEQFVNARGLGGSVKLLGQQSAVYEWIKAADMFVLPSRNEGLSNSLLEAMSGGLPVVATRVSGVPELVEETKAGLVTDVGNAVEFARSLELLANDPSARQEMGARARMAIEKKYSLETVAAGHEAMYRALIGQRSGE
jgi:glycosyltransferase involved in cell wall biosynthesis